MKKLHSRKPHIDSVEAYSCMCMYAACSCGCSYCSCDCGGDNNRYVSRRDNNADSGYVGVSNRSTGSTQNMMA